MELIFNTKNERQKAVAASARLIAATDERVKRTIMECLPQRMRKRVSSALDEGIDGFMIEEVRFRVNRPIQILSAAGELLLFEDDVFTADEAQTMLESVCMGSVYAKETELKSGFISLPYGVRVGIGGTPVFDGAMITRFTAISSFNFRLTHEVRGCAKPFIGEFMDKTRPVSCVIASPPGGGKTTFLRDIAYCFSMGAGAGKGFKVAVADERNELSGSFGGQAHLDLGARTDIICGVQKSIAIPMLIRSLSPDIIVTDELFGEEDAMLIGEAINCGVAVFSSIHAGSRAEILSKEWLVPSLSDGRIRAYLLKRNGFQASLERIGVDERKKASVLPC